MMRALTDLQNSVRVGLSGSVWENRREFVRNALVVVGDRDRALYMASGFSELKEEDARHLDVGGGLEVKRDVE